MQHKHSNKDEFIQGANIQNKDKGVENNLSAFLSFFAAPDTKNKISAIKY